MTPDEIRAERAYRYTERLGILCGTNAPTEEEKAIARKEANDWKPPAGEAAQEFFNLAVKEQ